MSKKVKVITLTLAIMSSITIPLSTTRASQIVQQNNVSASTHFVSSTKRTFTQYDLIPTDTLPYVKGIEKLNRNIRMWAIKGIDERVLKSLISKEFYHSGLTNGRQVQRAQYYVEDNLDYWVSLLERYDYNYELFFEALKFGKTSIDYLYLRQGPAWNLNLSYIRVADGSIYASHDTVASFAAMTTIPMGDDTDFSPNTPEILKYGGGLYRGEA